MLTACTSGEPTGSSDQREGSVLLVLPTLHVGGAERLVEWTAPLLQERGFHVAVLTLFDAGPCADALRRSGIPLYSSECGHRFYSVRKRLPRFTELFAWPGLLSGLRRDTRQAMYSVGHKAVLHVHCRHAQLPCRGITRGERGWSYIETFHLPAFSGEGNWLKHSMLTVMLRHRLRHVELGLCCGQALMESLRLSLPDWAPLATVRNGIPLPREGGDRPDTSDSKSGADVVFVGSGKTQKNLPALMTAFSLLVKRLPETRLTLCGKIGPDDLAGPAVSTATVGRLIREGRVLLSGVVHNIPKVLARTQVACLPSRWEALPIAGLEMLFYGNNVVLSDIGPHREISNGGRYARLADPKEPEEIAAALEAALTEPVDEELAAERRSWIRANYSLEQHVDALAGIYRSFLSGVRPGVP